MNAESKQADEHVFAQACGILLLDKEAGISSADVLRDIKRKFPHYRYKIGHAGTLDPFATGLLVVLVGRATRLVPFLHEGTKSYEGSIRFGLRTDTDDGTGRVLEEQTGISLCDEECIAAARNFLGLQQQVPPKYSAVKIAGTPAYELARQGKDVELRAKEVRIDSFELERSEVANEMRFQVRCSGGTYIRALARDLGNVLGFGACLTSLRRTGAEPFSIAEAQGSGELQESSLLPWYVACRELPRVFFTAEDGEHLLAGRQHPLEKQETQNILDTFAKQKFAVFADKNSETPLGLLQRNSLGKWEIVVNFGFPQGE